MKKDIDESQNPIEQEHAEGSAPKETLTSRRDILTKGSTAGLALGAIAMPDKWIAPVVESVTLPAHALTTTGVFSGSGNINFTMKRDENDVLRLAHNDKPVSPVMESLFPQAHASDDSSANFFEAFLDSDFEFTIAIAGGLQPEWALEYLEEGVDPEHEEACAEGLVPFVYDYDITWWCVQGKINQDYPNGLSVKNCDVGSGFPPISAKIERFNEDGSVDVLIDFTGAEIPVTLSPGGSAPFCPNCEDHIGGLFNVIESPEFCDEDF